MCICVYVYTIYIYIYIYTVYACVFIYGATAHTPTTDCCTVRPHRKIDTGQLSIHLSVYMLEYVYVCTCEARPLSNTQTLPHLNLGVCLYAVLLCCAFSYPPNLSVCLRVLWSVYVFSQTVCPAVSRDVMRRGGNPERYDLPHSLPLECLIAKHPITMDDNVCDPSHSLLYSYSPEGWTVLVSPTFFLPFTVTVSDCST
jgi:hypothetical protein